MGRGRKPKIIDQTLATKVPHDSTESSNSSDKTKNTEAAREAFSLEDEEKNKFNSLEELNAYADALETFSKATKFVGQRGRVRSIKDGIVICDKLNSASYGEMVTINGTDGMILNLEKDSVGIVIFGNDNTVKVGDLVVASGDLMSIKVSEDLLGRVVNALGILLMVLKIKFRRGYFFIR